MLLGAVEFPSPCVGSNNGEKKGEEKRVGFLIQGGDEKRKVGEMREAGLSEPSERASETANDRGRLGVSKRDGGGTITG
jgi:hypothetical protein